MTTEQATEADAQIATGSDLASASDVVEDWMVPIPAENVADGEYDIEVDSSSSMFNITACKLTVADGKMTAVMTMGGKGYRYLYMGTGEDAVAADESEYIPYVEDADGEYTVEVTLSGGSGRATVESPTKIKVENGIATATIIMSSSNYDYVIVCRSIRKEILHLRFRLPDLTTICRSLQIRRR